VVTVSLDAAGAGGAAIAAVKRMAQNATERRKDDFIGKKYARRFLYNAQGGEAESSLLGRNQTTAKAEHSIIRKNS